jgi:Flp pilus assembly protein CpaB
VGNRRTLIAAAAIMLAVAAGLGVYMYTSGADQRAQEQVKLVDAYVAASDIPKGTSGDSALADGLIHPEKVLAGSLPPAAVRDSSALAGKIAASTIQEKQYITESSFVSPSEGGGGSLAAAIGDKDLVAVTVSVDAARAVANQIAPGDRVNLAVVTDTAADYILENVKVLAVGAQTAATTTETGAAPTDNSGLITFEVSPDNALLVATAAKSGTLYLTLRPRSASGRDGGSTTTTSSIPPLPGG